MLYLFFDFLFLSVIGFDGGKNISKMVWYIEKGQPVIIGAVPFVPETYSNCKIFFDHITVSDISYKLSADLKLG